MAVAKNRQNKRSNALVITEALLVSYVGYITSFLLIQLNFIAEPDIEKLTINIFLITLCVLLCSLSVGLYEAKLRETFRGIIRRIFVSLGLTYFIVEILTGTLFSSLDMHSYYLPTAISLNIIALVFFIFWPLKFQKKMKTF